MDGLLRMDRCTAEIVMQYRAFGLDRKQDTPSQSSPECSLPCHGGDRRFKSDRGCLNVRSPDCRRSETGPAISLGVAWSPSGRGSRFKPGTVWGQISPTRLIIVTGTVAQFGRGARLRTELLGVRISPVLLWGFVSHGSLSVKPLSINSEVVMRGSIPSKLNLLRPPGPQSEKICDTSISRSIA